MCFIMLCEWCDNYQGKHQCKAFSERIPPAIWMNTDRALKRAGKPFPEHCANGFGFVPSEDYKAHLKEIEEAKAKGLEPVPFE